MLAGSWCSVHTSLSFSIYANSPLSCRIHVVSQLLLEVFLDSSNHLISFFQSSAHSADSLSFPPLRVSPAL